MFNIVLQMKDKFHCVVKSILGLSFAILVLAPKLISAQESSELILSVGEIKNIYVGNVVRIAVAQEDLVSVSAMDNGEIILIPKLGGNTELFVWKEGGKLNKYSLTILPTDMTERKNAMDSILRSFPGLVTRISGDKIIVEGTLEPLAVAAVTEILEDIPNTIALIEPMFSQKEMINVKMTVLEVDKLYSKEIGINWADEAEGPTLGTLFNFSPNPLFNDIGQGEGLFSDELARLPVESDQYFSFGGIASTLTSSIRLIEENGGGRILAEPTLSTRSGESARFFAGGEIPFQIIGPLGQTQITFFEFGVILEIAPISDGNGNIYTSISAEVSTIDNSVTAAGIPGKLTRQTQSTINVLDGQTIAISGLVSVNDAKTIDQVPLIGSLPIIGNLFKSTEFREQRTELIILITPSIVDSNDTQIFNPSLRKIKEELDAVMGGNSFLQDELAR